MLRNKTNHILSLVTFSFLLVLAAGSSETKKETKKEISLPTNVTVFRVKTPSLIQFEFEVTNPTGNIMPVVSCLPFAYVDSSIVSSLFLQGGSLKNVPPKQKLLRSSDIEINEQQASFVNKVTISCTSSSY